MINVDENVMKQTIESFSIPPKPQVLIELQQELSKQDINLVAFADVISKDVAMSAAILKTINSPSFGFNRAITDIKQSVIMLGAKFITTFATQFQLKQALNHKSSISYEKFWDTATETANLMQVLIEHLELKSSCPVEDAYSFGLFRDCGIPLMAIKYDDYKDVLMKANNAPERIFTDVEEDFYSSNHAIIGYYLANSWHFPKPLCELVLRHHDSNFLSDNKVSDNQKDLYALAKMAGNILHNYRFGQNDSEWLLAHDSVLTHFRLSDMDYEDLEEDVKEAYRVLYSE